MRRIRLSVWICAMIVIGVTVAEAEGQEADAAMFNTVKQKLAGGQQVVGGTISTADPDIYCAMASAGFDFLWIEMQHSPMTYTDVARMIRVCPGPAVPFIRVPDATEGDIQKATDIGALGIIIPMVDSVEKVENAITFAKYPPIGKRSQGGGQYRILWGQSYRQAANDNIMIVAMIENPAGAAIADQIANIPGVDVVFAASSDLGSFSGLATGRSRIRSAGYPDQGRDSGGWTQAGRSRGLERHTGRLQLLSGTQRDGTGPNRCQGIAG